MSEISTPPPTDTPTVRLHVDSETAPLERVIVHTPGEEMSLVLPDEREDLLFDDVLYVDQAREEHEQMCAVYRKVIGDDDGVMQIGELLHEAFHEDAARTSFVNGLAAVSPERNLHAFESKLVRMSPDELYRFAMTGKSLLPVHLDPVPNLLFTRDVAATVGEHMLLSHPATGARSRESVIMRTVVNHHPAFADVREKLIELPQGVTFEGGDLIMAGERTVLIGHSERTSFSGVMAIAEALFERDAVDHVVMVDLPKKRYCMHLDTVFNFISDDECIAFPPFFDGSRPGNVVHFSRSDSKGRFYSELTTGLKEKLEELLERELTFLSCGGNDPVNQRREQWTDGANFFALAPGVVMGYERNHNTYEQLQRAGYRVVTAEGFLHYHAESTFARGEKIAVKMGGMELSRGRGGPRCMTLPLARSAN